VLRHALLAAGAALCVAALYLMFSDRERVFRLSMGTAYASLAALAVTLLLGPLNVLRGRPSPVSTDLRRDIGIWGAILAAAHTVFGLQVHLGGKAWLYFVWPADQKRLVPFRYDWGGLANYTGLGSLVVLLGLLALSNDVSLRRFGPRRWKALQRWNYAAFALLAAHAVIYQAIERRTVSWMVTVAAVVTIVVAIQAGGWVMHRRSRAK